MNNKSDYISKQLNIQMDWFEFLNTEWEIRSNWDGSEHIIKIFDLKGRFIKGWYLQGIRV